MHYPMKYGNYIIGITNQLTSLVFKLEIFLRNFDCCSCFNSGATDIKEEGTEPTILKDSVFMFGLSKTWYGSDFAVSDTIGAVGSSILQCFCFSKWILSSNSSIVSHKLCSRAILLFRCGCIEGFATATNDSTVISSLLIHFSTSSRKCRNSPIFFL